MNNLTVRELKKKAQQLGVKVKGQGWKGCCPPEGKKADIISAIKNKGSTHRRKASTPKRNAAPMFRRTPKKKKRRVQLTSTQTSLDDMPGFSRHVSKARELEDARRELNARTESTEAQRERKRKIESSRSFLVANAPELLASTETREWSRDQCLLKCRSFMRETNPFIQQQATSPQLTKGQKRYKETLEKLAEKYGSEETDDDTELDWDNEEEEEDFEWELAELKSQLLDPDLTDEQREELEDKIAYIQEEIDEAAEYIAQEDDVLLGSGEAASRSGWSRSETKRMNRLRRRLDRLHRNN
jgi:hypothetical protein